MLPKAMITLFNLRRITMNKKKMAVTDDKWDRTQWKHLDRYLYRMSDGMFVTEMVEKTGKRKKCTRFETRAEAVTHILETQLARRNGGSSGGLCGTGCYAHHRPDDLHHQVRKLDGLLSGKKGQHG